MASKKEQSTRHVTQLVEQGGDKDRCRSYRQTPGLWLARMLLLGRYLQQIPAAHSEGYLIEQFAVRREGAETTVFMCVIKNGNCCGCLISWTINLAAFSQLQQRNLLPKRSTAAIVVGGFRGPWGDLSGGKSDTLTLLPGYSGARPFRLSLHSWVSIAPTIMLREGTKVASVGRSSPAHGHQMTSISKQTKKLYQTLPPLSRRHRALLDLPRG